MAGRETALARAREMRTVLLDHGVPEVSIELQQGRPTSGDRWNACNPVAVMSHHIASHPTPANPIPGLWLVKNGRSDLPGPLCNGTAGVDLVYRIICLGYANHSGAGGPWVVSGPLGRYRIPRDVGRPYIWGTEYEGGYTDEVWDRTYTNRRTGKKMTFREFMGRCNAGLVEAIWLPGISSRGKYDQITPGMDLATYHGEHGRPWAVGRKPDRRGYTSNVAIGRNEIRRYATEKSAPTTPEPQEADDMAGWEDTVIRNFKAQGGEKRRYWDWFMRLFNTSHRDMLYSRETRNRTRRIEAALQSVADGMDGRITPGQVRTQVDAALNEVIPEDAFTLDPQTVARELAPLLLAHQTQLTEQNIESALSEVFGRLAGATDTE